jgi:hypothetical protein
VAYNWQGGLDRLRLASFNDTFSGHPDRLVEWPFSLAQERLTKKDPPADDQETSKQIFFSPSFD